LKSKKIAPPFIPDVNESYFDTDYLAKHIKENPDESIPFATLGNSTKDNLPWDQAYCGYSFYNPAEDLCFFSPKKDDSEFALRPSIEEP